MRCSSLRERARASSRYPPSMDRPQDGSSDAPREVLQRFRPKPRGLIELSSAVEAAFFVLEIEAGGRSQLTVDVSRLDAPVPALRDRSSVVIMTMRKLQALYYCTQRNEITTVDVVISLISDLNRSIHDLSLAMSDPSMIATLESLQTKMEHVAYELMDISSTDDDRPFR